MIDEIENMEEFPIFLTTQENDGIFTFDLTSKDKPTQIPSTTGLGFRGITQYGSCLLPLTLFFLDKRQNARPKRPSKLP